METLSKKYSVNSVKPQTDYAVGNTEPSRGNGRCNDYPEREYTQASGSAENPNG